MSSYIHEMSDGKPPQGMSSYIHEMSDGKPPQGMSSYIHEMSDGKPPQGMPSNIHEMSKEKQRAEEMLTSGDMTHDYVDTDPYHDTGAHKPSDYHYDHSYDSYEYIHHADVTTTPPPSTPPPTPPTTKKPVFSYLRVGFKLFYIPLYASMFFVGYVLILIINSIQRHKAQVPFNFLTNPPARMLSDDVLERVIRALETSRKRYSTRHK
jgi:hypothetical protein